MTNATQAKPERLIDARGPRYTAAITTVVLSAALVTESNLIIGFQLQSFYQQSYLDFVDPFMVLFIAT